MQKNTFILISLILALISCKNEYSLDIENIPKLRNAILESEKYMKKIEVLPAYSKYYAEFGGLNLGRIDLFYSTLNYDPNDSIWMRHYDSNWQSHVDTLQNIPGLNSEEWQKLKSNLKVLGQYGIHFNFQAYHNDGRIHFFYYAYKIEKYEKIGPPVYLAILPESLIQTDFFKSRFIIIDRKDDLYLLNSTIWN